MFVGTRKQNHNTLIPCHLLSDLGDTVSVLSEFIIKGNI